VIRPYSEAGAAAIIPPTLSHAFAEASVTAQLLLTNNTAANRWWVQQSDCHGEYEANGVQILQNEAILDLFARAAAALVELHALRSEGPLTGALKELPLAAPLFVYATPTTTILPRSWTTLQEQITTLFYSKRKVTRFKGRQQRVCSKSPQAMVTHILQQMIS